MEVDEDPEEFASCQTGIDDLSRRTDNQEIQSSSVKDLKERHSGGSQYHSIDEEIPICQFSQSLRALDMACYSERPLVRKSEPPKRLNFVSFEDLLKSSSSNTKCSMNDGTDLSLDDDNEEDMFLDAKDEEDEVRDDNSEETFHGFSSNETEHSRSIADICSQRLISEDLESTPLEEYFHGFTNTEKNSSIEKEIAWLDLLRKYDSEIASEIRAKNFEPKTYDGSGVDCLPRIRELKNLERRKSRDRKSTRKSQSPPRSIEKMDVMIKDDFENDNSSPSSTAKRRKINISSDEMEDETMQNLIGPNCLLEEIRKEPSREISQKKEKEKTKLTLGFTTARGAKLTISKESLSRAQASYEKIEVEVKENFTGNNIEDEKIKDDPFGSGFTTARGAKLKVSKESLSRAQARYKEIENEVKENVTSDDLQNEKTRRDNFGSGFKTARGAELKVSEESLLKAQARYKEIANKVKENLTNDDLQDEKTRRDNFGSGFKTARGAELKVSEESLLKAQARYKEIANEVKENLTNDDLQNEKTRRDNFGSGFTTARGAKLKVSEESLSKAQARYKQIENEVKESLISDNLQDGRTRSNNFGSEFTTARGANIKVSKESLSRAQARYKEVENEVKENLTGDNLQDENTKCDNFGSGFTTARGVKLKISQKSLSKAQARYKEIENEVKDNLQDDKIERAKGQSEKIENEIKEIHVSDNVKKDKTKNENFGSGFTTAGGRELKISKEALSKAQAQFDELTQETKENLSPVKTKITTSTKNTLTSGFTTAGGRELTISQEALSQATEKYRDIENDESLNSQQTKLHKNVEATKTNDDPTKTPEVENFESLEFDDFTVDEYETARKRKFEEIDDDTPLRGDQQGKRKKGRYVSDLQGRKLFEEEGAVEDTLHTRKTSVPQKTSNESQKSHISAEIVASTAALLEDEENSNGFSESEIQQEMEVDNVQDDSKKSEDKKNVKSSETGESIPDDLNFDSQFSEELHHGQVINNFIMETMKTMEARLSMISKQDETIRTKMRSRPKTCDGSLYQLRNLNKNSRISWRELTEGISPTPREISSFLTDSGVLSITSNSANSYTFSCADFYGGKNVKINVEGIAVGDEALLILDERNCAGAREFERAFLASPGVNPNLVPTGWIKNHYRWIVWKLASMDRMKFGTKFLPRMLTPNRVMLELKYRYDREIHRSQWPPLRRILEKNDNPGVRIVLCVASINIEDEFKTPARRSSGTPGSVDSSVLKMTLSDGWYSIPATVDVAMINCIRSGKIKEGTKLVTCGASVTNLDQGCSVLEIPESVTLKIHTNSTRRARWDTKMDFCYRNQGPMCLSLKSVKSHGGAICKIIVAVARSYPILYREKLSDGQFVFRNARCEEEAARAHEVRCQAKIEEICEKARTDLSLGSQNNCDENEIRRRISIKMRECLPPPRDVTSVLKVRIADGDTSAMMTVWAADDKVFEEGSSLAIYNSVASGQRCNELQITAGRNTIFDQDVSRRVPYPERIFTSLMDVGEAGFNPVYGEFDTVGIVSSIGPAPHGMKNFETVNLACPRSEDGGTSDYLSILFWQGVSTHGYSKILTRGTLIACSNLEWRRNTPRSIPTSYCTERSIFTRNPRQKHIAEPLERLRVSVKDPLAYAAKSATLIQEEIARKTSLRTPENGTPYRTSNNSISSPGDFGGPSDANFTPNNSKKASIMRRIERLSMYGEPPKLAPISANLNSSPKVNAEFRSPVLTPVTKS